MQVLLVDKMTYRVDRCMMGFMEAGIGVVGSGSTQVAEAFLNLGCADLLVVTAEAAGKNTRGLINAAEARNANVSTILLAADVERATQIAEQSLPSVHCILGTDSTPDMILRMGLASLRPASGGGDALVPEPIPAAAIDHAPVAPDDLPVFSTRRKPASLAPTARAA